MAGAPCGGGNKHFRRGDRLPAAAVVLADPRFIKAQGVQPLDQFSIAFQGQGRGLAHAVKGRHERPEGHVVREHRHVLLLHCGHCASITAADCPVFGRPSNVCLVEQERHRL